MSRDTLIKLLARHCPCPTSREGWDIIHAYCPCGETFIHQDDWARHVANVIYPEPARKENNYV